LWAHVKKHWDLSFYAGGYPNPYSRSLTTDYVTGAPSIVGGADVAYVYDKAWGSLSFDGAYLGGKDDGGRFDPNAADPTGKPVTEGGRVYLTWTGFERPLAWLDLYHDMVLDVLGSAGVQLTRLDAYVTARPHRLFSLRLGYDHLSSVGIEMFLLGLLSSRADFKNVLSPTIENNLIVERTARDQLRMNADFHFARLSVWAEARMRWRSLVNAGEDPQFVLDPTKNNQAAPSFAWDFTGGVRDLGSLAGVRLGLWYTELRDYRSGSHILGFELGRNFWGDRLTGDLSFLYAKTQDTSNPGMGCTPGMVVPTAASLIPACYGLRSGSNYEPALTLTLNPTRQWYLVADYRLVVNQTDKAPANLLTHVALFRVEARY
jgi:hypothetical protein